MQLLLVAGPRKSIRQRHLHLRLRVPKHQRLMLRDWRYRQPVLCDQLHRPFDRNPNLTARFIHPAVVVQQQVLALVQICQILIAVVQLQPWSGKLLRQLRQLLLLQRRVRLDCLARSDLVRRVPLVRGAVGAIQSAVDHLPHAEAKHEEHANRKKQPHQENNDPAGIRIGDFVAFPYRRLVQMRLGVEVLAVLPALRVMHGHSRDPVSPQGADR